MVTKLCMKCNASFETNVATKFCNACRTPNPGDPSKGQCAWCSEQRTGRSKYCSRFCRQLSESNAKSRRSKEAIRERLGVVKCGNPYCHEMIVPLKGKELCSKVCLYVTSQIRRDGQAAGEAAAIRYGQLQASRIWIFACRDCGEPFVRKWKSVGKYSCCKKCAAKNERARNARKNHRRRCTTGVALGVHEIAKRDGERCNICRRKVDMTLSGTAKWGPTIDHLTPISKGGTNDSSNLALAHRYCNTSRGNRGHAQLLLVG